MCLPKNGMAMFTSETGQQALSLLQQLPGKVGCDVQRSRLVEEKIPEPNLKFFIDSTIDYEKEHLSLLITQSSTSLRVTVVGDNYSDYEIMMTVINDQRLIPAIDGEGGYQHVL